MTKQAPTLEAQRTFLLRHHAPYAEKVFEMRWRISQDPAVCVQDRNVRRFLRKVEHPSRPWIRPCVPTSQGYVAPKVINVDAFDSHTRTVRAFKKLAPVTPAYSKTHYGGALSHQSLSWWNDVRLGIVKRCEPLAELSNSLKDRLADYLSGYTLVRQGEQEKTTKYAIGGQKIPRRKAQKILEEFRLPSTHPYKSGRRPLEHLKTSITALMFKDLSKIKINEKNSFSTNYVARIVAEVWGLLEKQTNPYSQSRSLRRHHSRRK